MKLKVFVDDITACMEGRNKEVERRRFSRAMRRGVEEHCLKLSIT